MYIYKQNGTCAYRVLLVYTYIHIPVPFATNCYHHGNSDDQHNKKGSSTASSCHCYDSGIWGWVGRATTFRLQGVDDHRTRGIHLQLCGCHSDGRSGGNPGGEEGGKVHSRECGVGEPGKKHHCLRVSGAQTAEEALLHGQGAAAVLL